jgi:hypothetical protein
MSDEFTYEEGDTYENEDGRIFELVKGRSAEEIEEPCDVCDAASACVGRIAGHCSDVDEWDDDGNYTALGYWKERDPIHRLITEVKEITENEHRDKRKSGRHT